MTLMRKFLNYLYGPIVVNGLKSLAPDNSVEDVLIIYWKNYISTWVFRGLLGVIAAYSLSSLLSNPYFFSAAKEAIAPLFWNTIVVMGVLFALVGIVAGVFSLQSISRYFLRSGYSFMKFSSEVGALGYGVILGLLLIATWESGLNELIDYIYGTVGVILLIFVLHLNLIVWWIAYCLREDVSTPEYFKYVQQHKPLLIGLCIFSTLLVGTVSATATVHKPKQQTMQTCIST